MSSIAWIAIIIMGIIIVALLAKVLVMRASAKEIADAFVDRLETDTNTLIGISSSDKHMKSLAATINSELRRLREERHRFVQGDSELKSAVTNISHDLRTPLTAICGYLDLLETEEKSEEVSRYLEIITDRTENLKQLTEELFRYSVILNTEQDLALEPVEINRILEESIAGFYASLTEHGIEPQIDLTEKKIIRQLNAPALSRIFSNLINNTIKYSDGDLAITLTDRGEIIFANHAADLNEVQVGKLFDRFYTVDNARKSTGIGLSIAKSLVMQMNGRIGARYDDGKLIITISFPEQKQL